MVDKYLKEYMGINKDPYTPRKIEVLIIAKDILLEEEVIPIRVLPLARAVSMYLFKCQSIASEAMRWKNIHSNLPFLRQVIKRYGALCTQMYEDGSEPPYFAEFCKFGKFRDILQMEEIDFISYEDLQPSDCDNRSFISDYSNFAEDYDCNLCHNEFGLPDIVLDDLCEDEIPEDLRSLYREVNENEKAIKIAEIIFNTEDNQCPCTNQGEGAEVPQYRTLFLTLMKGLKESSLSADEYSQIFSEFTGCLLRGE